MNLDPHWAFIGAAYAATALCFGALCAVAYLRLRRWARAAREET
jgi:hypothetical protein